MALLKFKRSAVSGKVPALADLELGELAINTFDGKLYLRKDNGTASIIEVGAGAGSGVLSFNTRTGNVTLSSGDVTGALGYTPYNSSNPAGYITGITSGNVTTALGYTPANKAGDTFTGNIELSTGANRRVRIGSATNYYYDLSSVGDNFQIIEAGTTPRLTISYPSGAVTAATDMRAPIFYDSGNTGYYLDPAGSSAVNNIDVGSNVYLWRNFYSVNAAQNGWNTTLDWNSGSTIIYAGNSFRAPVFYDYDNTAYYLDASTSGNALRTAGYWRQDTTDWAGDINGKIQYHNNSWYFSAANEFIFRASNGSQPFYVSQGGAAVAAQDMRAPIFYDLNNTGYYVDPNATSNLNKLTVAGYAVGCSQTIDLSGLNQSTYYPVGIALNPTQTTRIKINVGLNSSTAPSWSTHPSGFTLVMDWEAVGGGWGTTIIQRKINTFTTGWVTSAPCGGITQNYMSSMEIVWLRGGGQYYVQVDGLDTTVTAYTSGYSYGGQTDNPTTSIINDVWSSATGGGVSVYDERISNIGTAGGSFRAPMFYDTNDTSFYLDPNGTSVLNAIQPWGEVGMRRGDSGVLLRSYNTSAGQPVQFYVNHNLGNVEIGNARGPVFAGGDYWQISNSARAPIFYDSDNTSYYVDPAGYTKLSSLEAALNDNKLWLRGINDTNHYLWNAGDDYEELVAYNGTGFRITSSITGSTVFVAYGSGNGGYTLSPVSSRAPIFYDSDNTGYYVNPSSSSTLANIDVASIIDSAAYYDAAIEVRERSFGGSQTTSFNNAPRLGFHWGGRVAMQLALGADGIFNVMNGDCSAYAVLRAGNVFGNVFTDNNNSAYYVDPSGDTVLAGNLFIGQAANASYIYMGDSDNGQRVLHNNSDRIGFLTQGGAWGSWCEDNGAWLTDHSMQSPIYYDRNDTGYYCDPNNYSQFSSVYTNNWFRSQGASGWYSQDYGGGIYMTDTTWVRTYGGKAFYVANEIAATGNITAYYSDERLKTKTGILDNALDKVSSLEGFLYVENDLARSLGYSNEKQQVGVSAQQVQAVLPEAVSLAPVDFETLEDGTIVSKSGEDYLTVDYSRLVPLLIEAIKELNNKVESLEAKLRSE